MSRRKAIGPLLALAVLCLALLYGRLGSGFDPPPLPALAGHNAATRALLAGADAALRDDPRSVAALERLALLYHAHQFHAEAAVLYRRLQALEPRAFRWAYLEAATEEALGRWTNAERAWKRATELDPKDADAWARLSALQTQMGHDDEGRLAAERAFAADPRDPLAALAWSRALGAAGDWTGAAAVLEPVLERHPRFAEGHRQLARAYGRLGRPEDERREIERGQFGETMESALLREVFDLSVPAILGGHPERGRTLVEERCVRCHTLERTFDRPVQDLRGWAATVRRMQRLAGKSLLTDEEAADAAAYLASAHPPGATGR